MASDSGSDEVAATKNYGRCEVDPLGVSDDTKSGDTCKQFCDEFPQYVAAGAAKGANVNGDTCQCEITKNGGGGTIALARAQRKDDGKYEGQMVRAENFVERFCGEAAACCRAGEANICRELCYKTTGSAAMLYEDAKCQCVQPVQGVMFRGNCRGADYDETSPASSGDINCGSYSGAVGQVYASGGAVVEADASTPAADDDADGRRRGAEEPSSQA